MKGKTLKKYIHPIHNEGYLFIFLSAFITVILYANSDLLGLISGVITLWVIYFFRDPIRCVPQKDNLVVAGADGYISDISEVHPPKELELEDNSKRYRVSVFLSVIDVHVNRTPVAGVVKKVVYHKGKFLSAELDKASDENERNTILIEDSKGNEFVLVQIAGLVARRIVCDVEEDESIERGQRVGIIRFGSRVDIYLPAGIVPTVAVGQRTIGGETIIAELGDNQPESIMQAEEL